MNSSLQSPSAASIPSLTPRGGAPWFFTPPSVRGTTAPSIYTLISGGLMLAIGSYAGAVLHHVLAMVG